MPRQLWKSIAVLLYHTRYVIVDSQNFPREPPFIGVGGNGGNSQQEQQQQEQQQEEQNNQTSSSSPTSPCSICLDGSQPISSSDVPFAYSNNGGLTCNDVVSAASAVSEGTETCQRMQLAGFQGGCCGESSYLVTPESFDRCPLCPQGEGVAFLPFKEIPGTASSTTAPLLCSDLRTNTDAIIDHLQRYVKDPGLCEDTILRRSAAWCGCFGASIGCTLCNGEILDQSSLSRTHPLTRMSCEEMVYQVALFDSDRCSDVTSFLQFDPNALCCPLSEIGTTTIPCPLCTEQQEFIVDNTITTVSYGDVTCGDAQAAANLLTSDQVCTDLRLEFSNQCCLETTAHNSSGSSSACALICPDTGEGPKDLFLTDPVTGFSCDFWVSEYAKLTASQCVDAPYVFGFDAVSFCCNTQITGDNGVSINSNTRYDCKICPPGQSLLYPSRVLFAYKEHTCSEIEEAASFLTEEMACMALLDESRALSNCACRSEYVDGDGSDGDNVVEVNGGSSSADIGRHAVVWLVTVFSTITIMVTWGNCGISYLKES